MASTRNRSGGLGVELAVTMVVFAGLVLGLCGLRMSRAEIGTGRDDDEARQLTAFGVVATPGTKTTDASLTSIRTQLDKLLPKHGFRLLDVQKQVDRGGRIGHLRLPQRLYHCGFPDSACG